jgi:protein-S-isoprenylcysteine O-methyltransferase Ste14
MAGLVPWWLNHWTTPQAEFPGAQLTRALGVVLILLGTIVLAESFVQFAVRGLGTPAPIAPPQNLVVCGAYRHVRNPMYVAVLALILGQAALFCDWHLIIYALLFGSVSHLFVVGYEEPTLHRRFGAQFEAFVSNVPRWIPRLTPWVG